MLEAASFFFFWFMHCSLKQILELHFYNFSLYVLEFLYEKSLAG